MLIVLSLVLALAPGLWATGTPSIKVAPIADTCYPSVGCFSNEPPWTTPARPALPPRHPANVSTTAMFYSREKPKGIQFPTFPEINLASLPIKGNRSVFIIFHCYLINGTTPWIMDLKDSLLRREDAEVYVPAFGPGAASYEQAVGDARVMAKLGAQVIDAIGADPSYVHLIGHCLGAQIASYTAKYLGEQGRKPARLTALDPAGPLFEGTDPSIRLTPEDADLVEVLHTDTAWAGMWSPSGHVDFYFNGGLQQPGCKPSQPQVLATCSKFMSHVYYLEALNNDCMVGRAAEMQEAVDGKPREVKLKTPVEACRADTCAPVDLDPKNHSARGIFMVVTKDSPPYCLHL